MPPNPGKPDAAHSSTIAVIGAGFVGVTTAVACAEAGHQVRLVETDPSRRERLAAGHVPFFEDGLPEAYRAQVEAGGIEVADRLSAALPPDVVYVAVGTPQGDDGAADLSQIEQAARDTGRFLARTDHYMVVAVKSTVPPGTTRNVVRPALIAEAGTDRGFGLAMTPEFLREGSALADAREPSRIVVGAFDTRTADAMRRLHRGSACPLLTVAPEAAELIKYASNALLATKVAFANEMGNLAEVLGLDIDEVMAAVGMDPRINPQFLQAGLGFGGSCFPKDVAALRAVAAGHGHPSRILDAVLAHNEQQPLRAVDLAAEALGTLEGRRIALLGLAFKPGTSDVRESRAIPIYRALRAAGARVVCYDPVAGESFRSGVDGQVELARSVEEALADADGAILQTAWPEFRALDPNHLIAAMRRPLMIDGRRALDPDTYRRAGVHYFAIGNGTGRYHESSDPSSRPRHEVPPRNEERAQGDAAAPRQAGHPVRR